MKLVKMKEENQFALALLKFSEIKVIRDACQLMGKQGSQHAAKIAAAIDEQLENMTI